MVTNKPTSTSQLKRRIELPLAIVGFGDTHNALRQKLFLIEKFKLAESKSLVELIRRRTKRETLDEGTKNLLGQLWKSAELDDLDLTELFLSQLPTIIDQVGVKFLEMIDPMPWFHKQQYGEHYEELRRAATIGSARKVARVALPRVRAKLALQEIICLITSDTNHFSQLISKSPRYLACPQTTDVLSRLKLGGHSGHETVRKKSSSGIEQIAKAIAGPPLKQARTYGYWQIDYYFNEVLACIKILNKIEEPEDQQSYLHSFANFWSIPREYLLFLQKGKGSKNPVETTLSIMIAKKMIHEASSYRNVIKPYVKKVKTKYPSIRLCDPIVEKLLDLPTRMPALLARFDLFKQLESFDFDLTEKELKIGHAISYPTTAIGV